MQLDTNGKLSKLLLTVQGLRGSLNEVEEELGQLVFAKQNGNGVYGHGKMVPLSVNGEVHRLDYKKHFGNLVKINESLNYTASQHYRKAGLTYVDVPAIVGITGACENVDTLFKVNNRMGLSLFFTQTGQLALEQALQTIPGAYTVIHSGRHEEEEDERHLQQFRLTEEEFDCTLAGMRRENYDESRMFEELLQHIQSAVQAMIRGVVNDYSEVLEKDYFREVAKLKQAVSNDFWRISYESAVKMLQKEGFSDLKFGDDLKSDHEAKVVELLNHGESEVPVFITRYPQEIKFFNMKQASDDPRVVWSADLILPYAGEATGSAVREHEYEKLNRRLLDSTMYRLHLERGGKYEDFGWYLNIMKNQGTNPHAGYGIGNERVLQYIFGERDIRNVSMFAMLSQQTGDWER